MKNLTTKQKQEIVAAANEHFDGDVQLASAAHIHGFGVVLDVGRQMVDWFVHKEIQHVQNQVENFIALGSGNRKPKAKKATGGKAKK